MNWTCAALGATVIIALLLFIPLGKGYLGVRAETLPESERVSESEETELDNKAFDA